MSFVFSQEYNAIRVRSERAFISLFSVYEEEGREKSAFGFEFEFFFENEDLNIPRQLFLFLTKKKRMILGGGGRLLRKSRQKKGR